MELRVSHCFLAVDDLGRAVAFYRDVLGFEVRADLAVEGRVTVVPPGQPDLEIVLEPPGVSPYASPADRELLEDLLAKGVLGRLVFVTDDLDATFDRIVAAGADVIQEPMNQPYGVRDCAFRDPAGNLLRFNSGRR